MRQEPHYFQKPVYSVVGLTLKLGAWQFRCGAVDPEDPNVIKVDLPAGDIVFTADPVFDKSVTLYVIPVLTVSAEFPTGSNYHLTEWSSDPALSQTSNPPNEKWTPDISIVPCLNITIKAGATTLEVTANEFEFPLPVEPLKKPPPDPRRDVVHAGLRVKAWSAGSAPVGWEKLELPKHAALFGDVPVSLGRLETGEAWFVESAI